MSPIRRRGIDQGIKPGEVPIILRSRDEDYFVKETAVLFEVSLSKSVSIDLQQVIIKSYLEIAIEDRNDSWSSVKHQTHDREI